MEFTDSFKEVVQPATEVPIVGKAMQLIKTELLGEEAGPWTDVSSLQKRIVPTREIDLTYKLPKEIPPISELETMSESSIIALRKKYSDDTTVQNVLAPYEHRASMRETIGDTAPTSFQGLASKLLTAGAFGIIIPAYAEAKRLGVIPTTIETSTAYSQETRQGWLGIGEGLKEAMGFKPEKETTQVVEGKIKQAPQQNNIEKEVSKVIDRLIFTESTGRHEKGGKLLTSSAGAKGITQVMPETGVSPGYGVAPLKNSTKEEYIRFSKDYLGAMLKKFGDMDKALAAYNAGPRKVIRALNSAERKGKDWKEFLPQETKDYIKKVQLEDDGKGVA